MSGTLRDLSERLHITDKKRPSPFSKVVGVAFRDLQKSVFSVSFRVLPFARFYLVPSDTYKGAYLIYSGKRKRGALNPRYFNKVGWAITCEGENCIELYFPALKRSVYLWLRSVDFHDRAVA